MWRTGTATARGPGFRLDGEHNESDRKERRLLLGWAGIEKSVLRGPPSAMKIAYDDDDDDGKRQSVEPAAEADAAARSRRWCNVVVC